ncbi:50S ribosomal protein L25/general stress protein Ctc [Candidatus Sumerlaeota bacterium]|nr:50S ribosomal protein L25/general stress protein Ctc [Candidatus Sumerlaeota bacterium]
MTEEQKYELAAEPRQVHGKGAARKLRARGMIPAVLYGENREPELLSVNQSEFEKFLHKMGGESMLVTLNIKGKNKKEKIFIKATQRHPITDHIIHVDFYSVAATKKIRVEVPVRPVGVCIGVKKGGVLEALVRTLEIKCLPDKIPHHIEVDVTNLDINHSIHTREIKIDDPDIELLTPPDTPLFTIVPPKVEVEAAAPEEAIEEEKPEAAEPEVIGKGKATKEEEEKETKEKN